MLSTNIITLQSIVNFYTLVNFLMLSTVIITLQIIIIFYTLVRFFLLSTIIIPYKSFYLFTLFLDSLCNPKYNYLQKYK